jgi:dUTPase
MCKHCAIIETLKTNVILPKKNNNRDIGLDILSPQDIPLNPNEQKIIFLNYSIKPPDNYFFQIMNCYHTLIKGIVIMSGIIKQGDDNNISMIIKNQGKFHYTIKREEKIGIGIFVKCISPEFFIVNRIP